VIGTFGATPVILVRRKKKKGKEQGEIGRLCRWAVCRGRKERGEGLYSGIRSFLSLIWEQAKEKGGRGRQFTVLFLPVLKLATRAVGKKEKGGGKKPSSPVVSPGLMATGKSTKKGKREPHRSISVGGRWKKRKKGKHVRVANGSFNSSTGKRGKDYGVTVVTNPRGKTQRGEKEKEAPTSRSPAQRVDSGGERGGPGRFVLQDTEKKGGSHLATVAGRVRRGKGGGGGGTQPFWLLARCPTVRKKKRKGSPALASSHRREKGRFLSVLELEKKKERRDRHGRLYHR